MWIGWMCAIAVIGLAKAAQDGPLTPTLSQGERGPLSVGVQAGSLPVVRFSGERTDLGALRGRYVALYRVNASVTDADLRLADRLVRADTAGRKVQICVLSSDAVAVLANLVKVKGAGPVLYSAGTETLDRLRPGEVAILNPNGYVVARWEGLSREETPAAVEEWYRRDAPPPGSAPPVLPFQQSWEKGKRLWLFLSSDSPVVELYLERIRSLAAEARKAGISVYGIFSDAAETDDGVAAFARTAQLDFPCVRDSGGALADACTIRVAPTAVLLDENGIVQYAGAVDSSTYGGDETREYLLSAVRALAAGAKPAVPYARPFGTAIVPYREGG